MATVAVAAYDRLSCFSSARFYSSRYLPFSLSLNFNNGLNQCNTFQYIFFRVSFALLFTSVNRNLNIWTKAACCPCHWRNDFPMMLLIEFTSRVHSLHINKKEARKWKQSKNISITSHTTHSVICVRFQMLCLRVLLTPQFILPSQCYIIASGIEYMPGLKLFVSAVYF